MLARHAVPRFFAAAPSPVRPLAAVSQFASTALQPSLLLRFTPRSALLQPVLAAAQPRVVLLDQAPALQCMNMSIASMAAPPPRSRRKKGSWGHRRARGGMKGKRSK
eukprot:NODE_25442_length_587_cov_3.067391.p2 GENE.NODE_25442_length_587_cov_3.067391~~NODE_25442_length_587_cov_3.067391.p2  ORF type:complete len:107 (-),score=22.91 NODE_25442_length_587_cov_3.067391:72-392(-)